MIKNKEFSPCCLLFCFSSGPLQMNVRMPVGGYTPGQTINLEIDARNQSDQDVDSFTAQLLKVCHQICIESNQFMLTNNNSYMDQSHAAHHLPHSRGKLTLQRGNHFDHRKSDRWLSSNAEWNIPNQPAGTADSAHRR